MNESFLRVNSNISTTRKTFWLSLGTGTGMELAFLITSWKALLFVGFFYLLTVILFNLIVFLNNNIHLPSQRGRVRLLPYTLLLLLNIPIAYLYLFILFY